MASDTHWRNMSVKHNGTIGGISWLVVEYYFDKAVVFATLGDNWPIVIAIAIFIAPLDPMNFEECFTVNGEDIIGSCV